MPTSNKAQSFQKGYTKTNLTNNGSTKRNNGRRGEGDLAALLYPGVYMMRHAMIQYDLKEDGLGLQSSFLKTVFKHPNFSEVAISVCKFTSSGPPYSVKVAST